MKSIKLLVGTLFFSLLVAVAGCGQKGPLIVERSDPFATDALQEEPADVEVEKE